MLWFDLELCRSQTNKGAYSFVVTQREKWTVESLRLEGSGLPEPDRALLVTGSVPLFSCHPSKRWAWVGARLHFVAVCVRNWGSPWRALKATGEGRTGHWLQKEQNFIRWERTVVQRRGWNVENRKGSRKGWRWLLWGEGWGVRWEFLIF